MRCGAICSFVRPCGQNGTTSTASWHSRRLHQGGTPGADRTAALLLRGPVLPAGLHPQAPIGGPGVPVLAVGTTVPDSVVGRVRQDRRRLRQGRSSVRGGKQDPVGAFQEG